MAKRDLDVVVFGATGITGRRVSAHLAERYADDGARWAAAARDSGKLARVLAEDGIEGAETIAAELDDERSLAELASRAKVVLNLVGPYTLYGRPVIEACVSGGAHYVDLTGEIPFARAVIDEFDSRAAEAGVKVVQVSGFEALPPDLAVLLAAEAARERWGDDLAEVDLQIETTGVPPGLPRPSDLLSGGTMQSIAAIAGSENSVVATDPAALIADPAFAAAVRERSPIAIAPRRSASGDVIAPMTPAAYINPAVIHRTAELSAPGERPEPFRYREGIAIPGPELTVPLRFAAAGAMSALQAGFSTLARSRRPALKRSIASALSAVLPSSGFGPAPDRLEDWSWRVNVEARTAGGNEVRVAADADGHPGYLATARILGEAGLLLAEAGATPERSGVLTPAIALGTGSAQRFEAARLRFSVGQ